jgi:peroxiredoxin Q/BCP
MVYGVNPASAESHARFAARLALPFPLLVDEGGRVARAWRAGLWRIVRRTVYVVTPEGRIGAAWRGEPPVEHILSALRPVC